MVQEQDGAGTVTSNLLTGLDLDELYRRSGPSVRSFLTDALGSVVALTLTDGTGILQTQYAYEPFGKPTASGSADSNAYQFTGREFDGATTGLYSFRARYYNPTFGRFVSEDPIGLAGGGGEPVRVRGERPDGVHRPTGARA